MLHMRNATQVISFVNVILTVIPPVYYSIERLPLGLQYFSYFLPTTHASIIVQYTMGLPTPKEWSLGLGIGVQLVYLIGMIVLAKTKALWREK
jgi:ABC-2 type transport system permease protein